MRANSDNSDNTYILPTVSSLTLGKRPASHTEDDASRNVKPHIEYERSRYSPPSESRWSSNVLSKGESQGSANDEQAVIFDTTNIQVSIPFSPSAMQYMIWADIIYLWNMKG
jgi:hypothetical protein